MSVIDTSSLVLLNRLLKKYQVLLSATTNSFDITLFVDAESKNNIKYSGDTLVAVINKASKLNL